MTRYLVTYYRSYFCINNSLTCCFVVVVVVVVVLFFMRPAKFCILGKLFFAQKMYPKIYNCFVCLFDWLVGWLVVNVVVVVTAS